MKGPLAVVLLQVQGNNCCPQRWHGRTVPSLVCCGVVDFQVGNEVSIVGGRFQLERLVEPQRPYPAGIGLKGSCYILDCIECQFRSRYDCIDRLYFW